MRHLLIMKIYLKRIFVSQRAMLILSMKFFKIMKTCDPFIPAIDFTTILPEYHKNLDDLLQVYYNLKINDEDDENLSLDSENDDNLIDLEEENESDDDDSNNLFIDDINIKVLCRTLHNNSNIQLIDAIIATMDFILQNKIGKNGLKMQLKMLDQFFCQKLMKCQKLRIICTTL